MLLKTKNGEAQVMLENVGLKHAKGKWLIFADADDFFLSDFEKMLDKYIDNEADMICLQIILPTVKHLPHCPKSALQ